MIVANVKEGNGSYGFNAATGEFGDMIDMGILDPAKVTRTAIQAAGSVAGMMITTEAMVTDIPKDDAPMPPPSRRRVSLLSQTRRPQTT